MKPERFDALERAGFKMERNGQLAVHIFERFGGHYLDVGASKKIVDGKVRSYYDVLRMSETVVQSL